MEPTQHVSYLCLTQVKQKSCVVCGIISSVLLGNLVCSLHCVSEPSMSKQTYRVCFCFRRGFKLKVAEAPSEIKALFNDYSEQGVMSLEQLQKFLIEVQGEDEASMEDVQGIMDSLHEFKHLPIFQLRKGLNLEAFFRYLCHDLNPPLSPHNTVISSSYITIFMYTYIQRWKK